MSPDQFDNTIQFRTGAAKEAADAIDTVRPDGINQSELARAGFVRMLRRILRDTDKISIYELYDRGELSEDAARILLGDEIDQMREDTEAFARTTEVDPDQFFVD